MEYNKMKRKINQIVVMSLTVVVSPSLLAGNLNSPAAPTDTGSAMYKLEGIYNRLNDGTEGTKRSGGFQEPNSGPTAGTGNTLNQVMEKAPVKDNTDGASLSDVTTGKTYWGLKDGSWGLQTAPRYIDNGDGTVTDRTTGLLWLQDASCADLVGTDSNGKANWDTATTAASSLANGTCELTDNSNANDWRLPTIQELQSVLDYSYFSPAISNAKGDAKWTADGGAFSGVQANYYWSSSIDAISTTNAWSVSLNSSSVNSKYKTSPYYVWPVRGGQ
jgi:hypothetical protein